MSFLGEIYKCAKRPIIWLGEEVDEISEATSSTTALQSIAEEKLTICTGFAKRNVTRKTSRTAMVSVKQRWKPPGK